MADVVLVRWTEADRMLLDRENTPEMTAHLGGLWSVEELDRRHRRFLDGARDGSVASFAVVDAADVEQRLGSVGYWRLDDAGAAWEAGWITYPEHHGRGVATAAVTALVHVWRTDPHVAAVAELHASPSVGNVASNAVAKAAGFRALGEVVLEYRGATDYRAIDWVVTRGGVGAGT